MNTMNVVSTEHMFIKSSRMPIVEEIVTAKEDNALQRALRKLRPMMESDLEELLLKARKHPLAVRLLDTPLPKLLNQWKHNEQEEMKMNDIQVDAGAAKQELFSAVYDMQLEALFRAWMRCRKQGEYRIPVVVIPANSNQKMEQIEDMTTLIAKQVLGEEYKYCHYRVEREALEVSALA